MQKILIISEKLSGQGGTEIVLNRFYENLSRHYQISFLLYNSFEASTLAPQSAREQFSFNRKSILEKISYKSLVKSTLVKHIQNIKPDIILCTSVDLLNFIPNQSNYLIYYWPHLSNANLSLKRKKSLYKANYILAISTEIATQVASYGYPSKNICTIFNPVKRQARIILDSKDIAHFIYIGRLHFEGSKNLRLLLDSCAELQFSYKVTIIGDGVDRPQLITHCKSLNVQSQVHFSDSWVASPWDTITAATAFVLPSTVEPFGLVITEALSYGLPCVATATEGPKDLIRPQQNGLLSPINDTQHFTEQLAKIYHTRQSYDAQIIKESIAHLYEDVFFQNLMTLFASHLKLISQ